MSHIIEFSQRWREVRDQIGEKSFLLVAPRQYGKSALFDACCRAGALPADTRCLRVSSRVPAINGQVDYGKLWESVQGHFRYTPKAPVIDCAAFRKAFEAAVTRVKERLVLLIAGAVRGNEQNHFDVLATFHWLMVNRPSLGGGKLTALASDDYSLFYWNKRPFLESTLHSYLPEVHISPLEVAEIEDYIRSQLLNQANAISADEVALVARRVHAVSGGHPGIAQELIDGLPARAWARGDQAWDSYVRVHRRNSTVLENLIQSLGESPAAYSQTALEYREPSFPSGELSSPRIHVLRQLGILQRETAAMVRLCGGAITTMIEEFGAGPGANRHVGTVNTASGSRYFVSSERLSTDDDDLVVVHLSDLHIGDHYRHRLPKGQMNPNEYSAGELIREDLKSMGLVGRLDALIITGDFVEFGEFTEFLRAREVVKDILDKIGLGSDKLLLIPGNHDIKWNPGDLASIPFGNKASREHYDAFLELLEKPSNGELDVLEITSRTGRTRLRILGLDSNRVEGPNAPGIGYVARSTLRAAQQYLDPTPDGPESNASRAKEGPQRTLIWMAVHHHIYPACSLSLAEAEGRKVSVMGNAVELLDFASRFGVEMVLHGHEHQPSVTDGGRWPVDGRDGFAPVTSVGAGSFGAARELLGPFSRNHYYVVHRRADEIIIRSRSQGAGGVSFLGHADLHIPRPCPDPRNHPPAPEVNNGAACSESEAGKALRE